MRELHEFPIEDSLYYPYQFASNIFRYREWDLHSFKILVAYSAASVFLETFLQISTFSRGSKRPRKDLAILLC